MDTKELIGIKIGGGTNSEGRIEDIMQILKSGQDQKTIREALRTYTTVAQVHHVTISDNFITLSDDKVKPIELKPKQEDNSEEPEDASS